MCRDVPIFQWNKYASLFNYQASDLQYYKLRWLQDVVLFKRVWQVVTAWGNTTKLPKLKDRITQKATSSNNEHQVL